MQDIHSIGGGRFFAGGGGGGDRRVRPHHLHQNQQVAALKCPRCDSLNTKFCYYNNYNLSQPRHFCKNCRRYWTKGGVLRNVPVGGGCRKTKRSKPKATSATSTAASTTSPPPPPSQDRNSNSNSSSESSSLTAATNTTIGTATATATEAVSAPSTSSASNLIKINQESKFFVPQSSSDPSFEASAPPPLLEQGGSDYGIFSDIGSFTSLITSSAVAAGAMPNFEYGSISDVSISPLIRLNQNHHQQEEQHKHHQIQQSQSWHDQQSQKVMTMSVADHNQELKMQEITDGLLDQTAQVDLSVLHDSRSNGGGFGSLGDWQQCGDQGLFDLPNTVDQTYWSQSQWTDQDHPSLYIP